MSKPTVKETSVNALDLPKKEKKSPVTVDGHVWAKLLTDLGARGIAVHVVADDDSISEITLGK
jgi:hypothetical protein